MKLRSAFMAFGLIVLAILAGGGAQAGERTHKDIQQALQSKGFNPGAIDGLWGKKSATALKDFQRKSGLATTGKIDNPTIAALFSEYSGLEDKLVRSPDGIENKPTILDENPALGAETQLKQKKDRIASKVRVAPENSFDDNPATTENMPSAVTTGPEVEVGNDIITATREKTSAKTIAIYVTASTVLAILLLFLRKRKAPQALSRHPVAHGSAAIERNAHQVHDRPFGHRDDEATAAQGPVSAAGTLSSSSIATDTDHDVKDWSRQNSQQNESRAYTANNDTLTAIEERGSAAEIKLAAYVAANDATVTNWVNENADVSGRRYDEAQRQHFATRAESLVPAASSGTWQEKASPISIAGITISKGMIYVGKHLPKDGRPFENENCVIDPTLKVGHSGDHEGRTMGYWPSYSSISPEARRSYLNWLAGDRSDPNVYIGYVFLYFYGLERHLMLEKNISDTADVSAEVRRLLEVYGSNHSFNRYAMELLTAIELTSGEPSARFLAHLEPNGYEVPLAIRIALGVRVRDNRIIEPSLLYQYAMTHPETRLRTPAKRAPELTRQLFVEQLSKEYPAGFRYKVGRAKPLQKQYRACSGSFQVNIGILGGNIPDIAHHSQPIGIARRIFDASSDALDDYSRILGRLQGSTPNLMAVSKLPKELRERQAALLEGRPLDQITEMARDATLTTAANVAQLVGLDAGTPPTKSKLREISQLLAAFGIGVTFDPVFAIKTTSGNDPSLIFLTAAETVAEPTLRFRAVQLEVMLGLVIGHADGHFHIRERDALIRRIEREPSLNADERSRLRAEIKVNEVNPDRLEDWMRRLKDISPDARMSVADELILVASADGYLHADEIRKLEFIFQRMGLAKTDLYDRLHLGSNTAAKMAAATTENSSAGISIAKPVTQIDLSKLHNIRSETSVTANVLAGIFADEDSGISELISVEANTAAPESGSFEGLEHRYGALLSELRLQASWAVSDFNRLARDAGLMPGAAREAINDWAMERFDELLIEGEDLVCIRLHLLPSPTTTISTSALKGIPA